jgi:ATP-dependent Clp endopeptidase proteolytic subunit ClpP
MLEYSKHVARIRARATAKTEGRTWCQIQALAGDPETTEILVYDEIGLWGVMAQDFVRALQMIVTPKILVRLNSPGGDVFDGLAIYNALRAHPATVQCHVDGLAASVASIIMLAGDTVTAAENSFVMVHQPWSIVVGDSEDMRQMADILDKVSGQIEAMYVAATGQSLETVAEWMSSETWFTGAEALAAGLVDELRDEPLSAPAAAAGAAAAAALDLGALFDGMPEALQRLSARARRAGAGQDGSGRPRDGAGTAREGAGEAQGEASGLPPLPSLARRRRLQEARLAGI